MNNVLKLKNRNLYIGVKIKGDNNKILWKKIKKMALGDKIGAWSFIAGLGIAILVGLIPGLSASWVPWVLAVIGVLIGILNIGDKEVTPFLVASIAFMLSASSLGGILLGDIILRILSNIAVIVAPAAAIVSLRVIYDLAKE
jgi:hypothetical protein